ncbi:MAG: hypothetical protein Q7S05_02095 [bacterium]|nr:hypothetical protein [bacterium]
MFARKKDPSGDALAQAQQDFEAIQEELHKEDVAEKQRIRKAVNDAIASRLRFLKIGCMRHRYETFVQAVVDIANEDERIGGFQFYLLPEDKTMPNHCGGAILTLTVSASE